MSTDKSKEAYKRWFEKNREKLNQERKARYHNDPEYQAKVKNQSKSTKQKRRLLDKSESVVTLSDGTKSLFKYAPEALNDLGLTENQFVRLCKLFNLDIFKTGRRRVLSTGQIKILQKLKTVKKSNYEELQQYVKEHWPVIKSK